MPDWWEEAVVYEIYPRSFQDSDGDGIGDLRGIVSRLDYLEWLGVDAIWLAPIYPSPLADYGYDVSDHVAIAPELGTDADYEALVDAAHARGIRVLMDLVASHTSIEHPWFRSHPERYVWADGGPPNNWVAAFGGPAWTRDERSGRWYLHSFFAEQPDLDWRNPEVREAISAVVRHWLRRGADGFRIDAVERLMKDARFRDDPVGAEPFPLPVHPEGRHLDPVHSRNDPEIGVALAALREAAGEAPLVGEVYLPGDLVAPYLDYLDRVFAFDLLHADFEAEPIAALLEGARGSTQLAWVISNHDFPRVATRWGEGAVRAAAMLLLTLPGTSFVYQGEEIGMVDGPQGSPRPLDRFGRDACRHPMQWTADAHGGFSDGEPWLPLTDPARRNVVAQRRDPDSVLALYRRLIALRGQLEGPLAAVDHDRGLLRYDRGEAHTVLLNLGASERADPRLAAGEPLARTSRRAVVDGALQPGEAVVLGPLR